MRIPGDAEADSEEEKAKALTRGELALLLAALPVEWRLFFEFLTHTGLRISEAIGRTWRVAWGKNVKQVQEWLGHADPGFTLRTYVHLLDEGLGDADFLDEAVTADPSRVNAGSTEGPQAAANAGTAESADMAL